MEAFYFKHKVKYLNGEAKDFCYYKLTKEGKITSISKSKRIYSAPKAITINEGFIPITAEEFEEAKKELGF
jgi:hypothetical protein